MVLDDVRHEAQELKDDYKTVLMMISAEQQAIDDGEEEIRRLELLEEARRAEWNQMIEQRKGERDDIKAALRDHRTQVDDLVPKARLAYGTLAGSVATYNEARRNEQSNLMLEAEKTDQAKLEFMAIFDAADVAAKTEAEAALEAARKEAAAAKVEARTLRIALNQEKKKNKKAAASAAEALATPTKN